MGKHISTEKPPSIYNNGEYCCIIPTVKFCSTDHKWCCHGGHGKRKRNIANYVRSLETPVETPNSVAALGSLENMDDFNYDQFLDNFHARKTDDRMYKGEGGDYS